MKFSRIVAPLLSLALCQPAHAATVTIRSCYDGDTCRTTSGERIRLACIDAAEKGQPGDPAATRKIRSLVEGKTVGIRRITSDRYGRTIAELYTGGVNVGEELFRTGNARIIGRYSHQCRWSS